MKINIFGTDIHYEQIGEGIPMLIIPGLFISSQSMMPVFEPVVSETNRFKRIYIDMPGMGQSPRHSLENNSESMIKIATEFVKQVIGDEPFYLTSYSYGGYIATGIAREMKEQVLAEIRVCAVIKAEMKRRNIPAHKVLNIEDGVLDGLDEGLVKRTLEDLVDITEENFARYKKEINEELRKADRKFILELFFNDYSWDENEALLDEVYKALTEIIETDFNTAHNFKQVINQADSTSIAKQLDDQDRLRAIPPYLLKTEPNDAG